MLIAEFIFTVQVYLVAGGFNDNFDGTDESISPTELLVEGIPSWTNADPLPWAASSGLQAVSIDNTVITTGQCISLVKICVVSIVQQPSDRTGGWDTNANSGAVYRFVPEDRSWALVGQMEHSRRFHAASVIPAAEVEPYCSKAPSLGRYFIFSGKLHRN